MMDSRKDVRTVTGVVLVDLSAAFDTVIHRMPPQQNPGANQIYGIHLTELIECMLDNRMFFVQLGDKKSRW